MATTRWIWTFSGRSCTKMSRNWSQTSKGSSLQRPRRESAKRQSASTCVTAMEVWEVWQVSRHCIQQRFGVLKIGSVKPLGKPGVDLGQQVVRLLPFPLLLPEPTQTHGSPQLQGFRLLAAGDVQGLLQPGFHLRLWRPRLLQEQDAPEATDFRFPPAFLMLLHQGVSLGQRLEAVFRVAQVSRDLRQQGAQVWNPQCCPRGLVGGDPLADLGHPRLTLALHGQRPSTQARSIGRPEGKSLLGRE